MQYVNYRLRQLLRDDIKRSVDLFASLPKDIREIYDLPNSSIEFLVGPDIESMLFKKKKMIAGQSWGSFRSDRHPLAKEFVRASNNNFIKLLYYDDSKFGEPVFFDGSRIEANLQPADPLTACNIYNKYDKRSYKLAKKMGLRFDVGSGHWHVSMWQDGENLLNSWEKSPRFALHAASGLAMMQEYMTALFVRPRIAEIKAADDAYCATEAISISDSSEDSIRFNKICGNETIECRLADGCPEQIISLILKGFLFGLKSNGHDPFSDQEHWVKYISFSDSGSMAYDERIRQTSYGEDIQYGYSRFKCILEEMLENEAIYDFYDDETANLLILDTFDRYQEYLGWKSTKKIYGKYRLKELKTQVEEMRFQFEGKEKAQAMMPGL